ncbi:MAG: hypothetical protein OEU97_00665 [Dehalococcoidia bacterium]|nr:hypothetical protein [Dehalococcoidia bacterium]MDH4299489.1 hypothetical protein [Dehalococcoidia bacterium]
MQPQNMTWVVAGKRYRTDKATLIAHDEYWNGYSWEQGGRNTFLFRTPNGNFFAQYQTLLPHEVETGEIVPLEINEAVSLYHSLYKKEVPFAVAFPFVKAQDA